MSFSCTLEILNKIRSFPEIASQSVAKASKSMKRFSLVVISLAVAAVTGWKHKYGNDFVTYSIGERFERGKCLKVSLSVFAKKKLKIFQVTS